MGRARTLVMLSVAALLVAVALVALRLRSGAADPLDARLALPPAQAAAGGSRVADPARAGAPAERSAIKAEAVPAAQFGPDSRSGARLAVELVAGGGPVRAGDVELEARDWQAQLRASVDPRDGCARFQDLLPGTYLVSFSNLPRGCLPPRWFRMRGNMEEEPAVVTVVREERRLRVELELSAHVFGSVRDPDGRLVRSEEVTGPDSAWGSVRVRFQCMNPESDRYVDEVFCDVFDGRYECELYAGLWMASVVGRPSGAAVAFLAPMPALRQLMPGASTEIPLAFRPPGTCELHGTIRDEAGKPFGGLRVSMYRIHSLVEPSTGQSLDEYGDVMYALSAEADGAFLYQGLEPGRYRVYIEIEDPAHLKLGEVPESRDVELVDAVTKFEYAILRAHPVHVRGTVVVDAAWAAGHAAQDALPGLELVWATGRDDAPEARNRVGYDRQGFECWIDAFVKDPRLEFTLAGEKLVCPLALSAEGDPAPLTIRFPR